jgi:NADH:ubiquinone oxidoreductase subunit 2 (subunit N)
MFLGAVLTVVTLYYYLLAARRMYIEAPEIRTRPVAGLPAAGIGIRVLGVVRMGLYPQRQVNLVTRVAAPLFA